MNEIRKLTQTEEDILLSMSSRLLPETEKKQNHKIENIDEFLRYAKEQAVYSTALSYIEENGLDEDSKYKKKLFALLKYNTQIQSEHSCIAEAMEEAKIPYVVFKGSASASYYPNPAIRDMGDIDLFCKKENFDKASDAIFALGYVKCDGKHPFHTAFIKDKITVELHTEISILDDNPCREKIEKALNDVISKSVRLENKFASCRIPDDFHHGLIMLLHICRHLAVEGIGLRHLCDWAVFIYKFSDEEFADLFELELKEIGLWHFATVLSLVAHRAFGFPYKSFMGSENELADALLIDFLDGGNFGKKGTNRKNEHYFLSNNGEKNGRVIAFVKNINRSISKKWHLGKKTKWLLPIGWVFYCIDAVCKTVVGKKKPVNVLLSYGKSKSRAEMMANLKLFCSEK